jgi:hypothetical protein
MCCLIDVSVIISETCFNKPLPSTGFICHNIFSAINGARGYMVKCPCGGGVEYLHRSPASRGRRRKGKSQIWESPTGLGPENDCAGEASSNCKWQSHPLVRESAPPQQTRNCLKVITIWSQAPDGCFIPRETGRLTVGRNIRWIPSAQTFLLVIFSWLDITKWPLPSTLFHRCKDDKTIHFLSLQNADSELVLSTSH